MAANCCRGGIRCRWQTHVRIAGTGSGERSLPLAATTGVPRLTRCFTTRTLFPEPDLYTLHIQEKGRAPMPLSSLAGTWRT